MTRTLTGLPADLPPAARAYIDGFPAGEIVAFPIGPVDRVDVPVWVVALFPEDPALAGIMPYGVGYGTTDSQAVLGSLGEIAEMVWPTATLMRAARTTGSHSDLVAQLGSHAVADPLTLCLPAGSLVGRDTVLEWVEARRWSDQSSVLVPIELAAYSTKELSPGYKPFTPIISNGMGAGPDLDWAIGHGLCEILQRDGNGLLFRALDRGVALDWPEHPSAEVADLRARFEAAGVRPIPKFATDEFGLTNIYCTGVDEQGEPPAPIAVTACGEACHPDRDQALAKALAEYAASRGRKSFAHGPAALVDRVAPAGYPERFLAQAGGAAKSADPRAFDEMVRWTRTDAATLRGWLADTMLAERTHKSFESLPHTPAADHRARSAVTRAKVEAAGFDILYVDLSPPDRSIAVVKVIVPGMEVETMSYDRIGARGARKLMALDSPLVRFGEATDTLRPVRMTPEALSTFPSQPLFDTALAREIVGPLYPLYREPEAHHVAAASA